MEEAVLQILHSEIQVVCIGCCCSQLNDLLGMALGGLARQLMRALLHERSVQQSESCFMLSVRNVQHCAGCSTCNSLLFDGSLAFKIVDPGAGTC